jgi:xanthine dehydrogenase accessory factor
VIDRRRIVEQWPESGAGVLVTLVRIEGSSYRRLGARMLICGVGAPAGTISGGCLESEVVRKAHWMIEGGARVETYSTLFDDTAEIPYGLGCGGVVDLLFEPCGTPEAEALRDALASSLRGEVRRVVTELPGEGRQLRRAVFDESGELLFAGTGLTNDDIAKLRTQTLADESAMSSAGMFVEELAPPQRLVVLGAGDDVRPLVGMAALLGWSVIVVDGRPQLARRDRFPAAEQVLCMAAGPGLELGRGDALVLMTHSYEQDRAWLRWLLAGRSRDDSDAVHCGTAGRHLYVGLLGARHRSALLIRETAEALGITVAECCERVWAPVGLDLGGDGPEAIALAVIAEVQAWSAGRLARSRRLDAAEVAAQALRGEASAYTQTQQCSAGLP